jgi:hypothetical protein
MATERNEEGKLDKEYPRTLYYFFLLFCKSEIMSNIFKYCKAEITKIIFYVVSLLPSSAFTKNSLFFQHTQNNAFFQYNLEL